MNALMVKLFKINTRILFFQVARLTSGSNRSLRSLGRAKARPLTKRYV